jgi:ribosomal protein S18 acetylase RimI-like enzyme
MEISIEDIVLEAAKPEDADIAARLIYDTDPYLIDYMFKGDQEIVHTFYEEQWKHRDGLTSHSFSTAARHKGALVGIELGYTGGTDEKHFPIWMDYAAEILPPEAYDHFLTSIDYFPYLVPPPPEDSYYVLILSVIPEARSQGIGAKLLNNAFERAKAQGLHSCHLDVMSDSPAVRFYKRMGMDILLESWCPYYDKHHNIQIKYRMVKDFV